MTRVRIFLKISIILFLISTIEINAFALNNDTTKTVLKIELWGYGGYLLAHHDEMAEMANHPYIAGELRMSFQTTGKDYWHELFKYPSYGFGLYSGTFNNVTLGNPIALFGFMEFPFLRKDKYYLSTSWSGGVAFNMNEYDSIANPQNIAIGTDVNAFVDFSALFRYKLNQRWEVATGFKLQHFSNGAIKYPNLGLNLISGQAVVSYYPGRTIDKFYKVNKPKGYKKHEFYGMYAGGIQGKGIEEPDVQYYNSTVSLGVNRRINYKRNIGIGADVFYNKYLENVMGKHPDDVKNSELMSYAVFASTDMIANKFRLVVQLGAYIWRATDYSIPIYERVAIRYYFIPNMFGNVSIKAHGAKAQFIEWGIGASF